MLVEKVTRNDMPDPDVIEHLSLIKGIMEGRYLIAHQYQFARLTNRNINLIEPADVRFEISNVLEMSMLIFILSKNIKICKLSLEILNFMVQEAVIVENFDFPEASSWSIVNNFKMYSDLSQSSYIITGAIAVHKRLYQSLQSAKANTTAIINAWRIINVKWRHLTTILKSQTTIDYGLARRWRAYSGFLASTVSAWIVDKNEHVIEGKLSSSSKMFLLEILDLLTNSQSSFMRETAREILSRDTNHAAYHFIFTQLEDRLTQQLSKNQNDLVEQDFFLLEQSVLFLRAIIEYINDGEVYLAVDIASLALSIVKKLDGLNSSERIIKLRIQYAGLISSISKHKDSMNMKHDLHVRNEVATIFAGWLDSNISYTYTNDESDSIRSIDTSKSDRRVTYDKECLQKDCIVSIIDSLAAVTLKLSIEVPPGTHEKDVYETKSHRFSMIFMLFVRVLEKCRAEELHLRNSLMLGDKLEFVKKKTIECASKLLDANVDVGLKLAFPLALHDDSFIRVAFLKILDNILSHSSGAETDSESDIYEKLAEFLAKNIPIAIALCDVCPATEVDEFSSSLLAIFESKNNSLGLVKAVATREVERADSPVEILRRNCVATKIVSIYIHRKGLNYLQTVLGPFIQEICAHPEKYVFETNPEKIPEGETIEENIKKFDITLKKLLYTLESSIDQIPYVFRQVCHTIAEAADSRYPGKNASVNALSAFFFLRFICPSMVSPESDGLVDHPPPPEVRRTLLILAKMVQNLAYGSGTFVKLSIFKNTLFKPDSSAVVRILKSLTDTSSYIGTADVDDSINTDSTIVSNNNNNNRNGGLTKSLSSTTTITTSSSGGGSTILSADENHNIQTSSSAKTVKRADAEVLHHFLYNHWEDINHKMQAEIRIKKHAISRDKNNNNNNNNNQNNQSTSHSSIHTPTIISSPGGMVPYNSSGNNSSNGGGSNRHSVSDIHASHLAEEEEEDSDSRVNQELTLLIRSLGRPKPQEVKGESDPNNTNSTNFAPRLREFLDRNSHRDMNSIIEKRIVHEGLSKEGMPLLILTCQNYLKDAQDTELVVCRFFQVASKMWNQKFALFYDFTSATLDNLLPTSARSVLSLMVPEIMAQNCVAVYFYNIPPDLVLPLRSSFRPFQTGTFLNPMTTRYHFLTTNEVLTKFNMGTLNLDPKSERVVSDSRLVYSDLNQINTEKKTVELVSIRIGTEYLQVYGQTPFLFAKGMPGHFNNIFHLSEVTRADVSTTYPEEFIVTVSRGSKRKLIFRSNKAGEIVRSIATAKARMPQTLPIFRTNTNDEAQLYQTLESSIGSLLNVSFSSMCSNDPAAKSSAYNLLATVQTRFKLDLGGMELVRGRGIRLPSNVFSRIQKYSTSIAETRPELTFDVIEEMFPAFHSMAPDSRQGVLMYIAPWIKNLDKYVYRLEPEKYKRGTTARFIRQFLELSIAKDQEYMFLLQSIWPLVISESNILPILIDEVLSLVCVNGKNVDDMIAILTAHQSLDACESIMARILDIAMGAACVKDNSLVNHPQWREIVILVSILSAMLFENPEAAVKYCAEICLIVQMFLYTGPFSFRVSLYNLLVNMVHSFWYSDTLSKESRPLLMDIWKEVTSSKGNMIFGISEELKSVDYDYPVTSIMFQIEACSTILLELSSCVSTSKRRIEYHERFTQQCLMLCTQRYSILQSRAVVTLGCSSKIDVSDETVTAILEVLYDVLSTNDSKMRDELIMCAAFSISRLARGLRVDSKYHGYLFWVSIALMNTYNMTIFGHGLQLLQTVIKSLDDYGAFKQMPLSHYLMRSRDDFREDWMKVEKLVDLTFTRQHFELALACTLLRGMIKSVTRAATLDAFVTLLSVSAKNQEYRERETSIVGTSAIAAVAAAAAAASACNGSGSGSTSSSGGQISTSLLQQSTIPENESVTGGLMEGSGVPIGSRSPMFSQQQQLSGGGHSNSYTNLQSLGATTNAYGNGGSGVVTGTSTVTAGSGNKYGKGNSSSGSGSNFASLGTAASGGVTPSVTFGLQSSASSMQSTPDFYVDGDDISTNSITSNREVAPYMVYLFFWYLGSRSHADLPKYLWTAGYTDGYLENDIPAPVRWFIGNNRTRSIVSLYLGGLLYNEVDDEETIGQRYLEVLKYVGSVNLKNYFRVYFVIRPKLKRAIDMGPTLEIVQSALDCAKTALLNLAELKRPDFYLMDLDEILTKAGFGPSKCTRKYLIKTGGPSSLAPTLTGNNNNNSSSSSSLNTMMGGAMSYYNANGGGAVLQMNAHTFFQKTNGVIGNGSGPGPGSGVVGGKITSPLFGGITNGGNGGKTVGGGGFHGHTNSHSSLSESPLSLNNNNTDHDQQLASFIKKLVDIAKSQFHRGSYISVLGSDGGGLIFPMSSTNSQQQQQQSQQQQPQHFGGFGGFGGVTTVGAVAATTMATAGTTTMTKSGLNSNSSSNKGSTEALVSTPSTIMGVAATSSTATNNNNDNNNNNQYRQ